MRGGRFGEEKATFKKNHGSSSKRTIYSCVCVCVCVCFADLFQEITYSMKEPP